MLAQVVTGVEHMRLDVVLGEHVPARRHLGPLLSALGEGGLIVLCRLRQEREAIEQDHDHAHASATQPRQGSHPVPFRRARHDAEGHAPPKLRQRGDHDLGEGLAAVGLDVREQMEDLLLHARTAIRA